MNALVEINLALILFLPWFLILSVLFWVYPRQPRGVSRRLFDLVAIAMSVVAFVASIHWSFRVADPTYGGMWRQVLATAVGYGVYLAVMTLAFFVRAAWLRRHRR
ncbi:hypothetical protein E4582_11530 [Luteimonas yindakuii]|uniref:Transmembrane protein n=1 Tax=Luteimonas yindakuii TaxID=2565782 RepID=A0A4Z1RGQ9_9GAMM|nr:hypothetical protein [Luteimonas yindakuii]QCO67030.1 hypothetical protein E5843_03190 [Luteimonas yindakuii]TKS52861.1 hypothetical protein E4582_11530 [Luteimonas yindakuii]